MTMPTDLMATPFASSYPDGVVEWIDVFGFAVPLTWGDPGAEYNAVRNHAAAMEFSMLHKWQVEGDGALETVNRVFSRDVSKKIHGKISYGVVVSENGKMVDDCTVFIYGADRVLVFGGNPQAGAILTEHASAGVSVTDRQHELAQLSVQGPASREILQKLTDSELSKEGLPYYTFLDGVSFGGGVTGQISRIGFTGELGYEILLPVAHAPAFWDRLFDAGTPHGLLPAGAAAVMMCRIEAGMIMGEVEYDHTMTPYDCRMGWAVDLKKPDFRGRAALETAKDQPSFDIVSVVMDEEGEFDGATLRKDGTEIGHITMAVPSPLLEGKFLGLARVRFGSVAPGDSVSANGSPATIMATPVFDPDRIRVRS